jgi:hypothetical protein
MHFTDHGSHSQVVLYYIFDIQEPPTCWGQGTPHSSWLPYLYSSLAAYRKEHKQIQEILIANWWSKTPLLTPMTSIQEVFHRWLSFYLQIQEIMIVTLFIFE